MLMDWLTCPTCSHHSRTSWRHTARSGPLPVKQPLTAKHLSAQRDHEPAPCPPRQHTACLPSCLAAVYQQLQCYSAHIYPTADTSCCAYSVVTLLNAAPFWHACCSCTQVRAELPSPKSGQLPLPSSLPPALQHQLSAPLPDWQQLPWPQAKAPQQPAANSKAALQFKVSAAACTSVPCLAVEVAVRTGLKIPWCSPTSTALSHTGARLTAPHHLFQVVWPPGGTAVRRRVRVGVVTHYPHVHCT
jgi:hypothetical protein